jgi:hypothetical protein
MYVPIILLRREIVLRLLSCNRDAVDTPTILHGLRLPAVAVQNLKNIFVYASQNLSEFVERIRFRNITV